MLAATFPWMSRYYNSAQPYVRVTEEVVAWLSVLASLLFIGITAWIWTRGKRKFQRVFRGVAWSLGVIVVTIGLSVAAGVGFQGDEEFIVSGILFLGLAALIVVWLQIWRLSSHQRPWHNKADGKLDLHCPACGYRMIGLKEARCPECGAVYTVDELLAQQAFAPRVGPPPPPDPPTTATEER
jgi:hypothetical protein